MRPLYGFFASLLIVIVGFLMISCKPRSFNASKAAMARSAETDDFEINDLAWLFPLSSRNDTNRGSPPVKGGRDFRRFQGFSLEDVLLPLTQVGYDGMSDTGRPAFLSSTQFNDLICQAWHEMKEAVATGDDVMRPLMRERCGTFQPIGTSAPAGKRKLQDALLGLAFEEPSRPGLWKIIAARIDLCAGRPQHLAPWLEREPSTPFPDRDLFLKAYKAHCKPQMRLVAQPLQLPNVTFNPNGYSDSDKGWQAYDFAMHLIYDLPGATPQSILETLRKLKAAAAVEERGLALDIHPGFGLNFRRSAKRAANNVTSADDLARAARFGKSLSEAFHAWKSEGTLSEVSLFGNTLEDSPFRSLATSWFYMTARPDPGNPTRLVPKRIPMVGGSHLMVQEAQERDPEKALHPTLTRSFRTNAKVPNVVDLAKISLSPEIGSVDLSREGVTAIVASSSRLSDPIEFNLHSFDCVSCHTASAHQSIVRASLPESQKERLDARGRLDGAGFELKGQNLSREGEHTDSQDDAKSTAFADGLLTQKFFAELVSPGGESGPRMRGFRSRAAIDSKIREVYRADYVQRNFGYFGFMPMVSTRTVNESALNATIANVLSSALTEPTKSN
ncbi:MAG: hypothetical protein IOD12_14575 [Silvanigrellales bacterium]|jgi:hypothetical protein|nr:hypothetical protein [Silvanigrellales bacterium]